MILELSNDEEWLFSENGNRIKSHSFRKKIYGLCKSVGIKERSPHKIRHAYAGVSDEVKKGLMGHSDIRTTQKYVEDVVSPDVFKNEIAKLPSHKSVTDEVTLGNVS